MKKEKTKVEEKKALASLEEIKAFCIEQGLEERDAIYLFYHWEENDWTLNNRPLKRWRMAVLAWKAAGHLPSQREKFIRKSSSPSAHDVRRVIREHRDRMVGLREADKKARWEGIFRAELQCGYEDAMRALDT